MRRDNSYWQRLRKDRRSNAAVLFAFVSVLTAIISLISLSVGTHFQARANPLYWVLMAPMIWWVAGLSGFEARHVRLWKPALALSACIGIGSAAIAMHAAGDWTAQTVACAVTLAAAAASMTAYRGSLVQREGPAR